MENIDEDVEFFRNDMCSEMSRQELIDRCVELYTVNKKMRAELFEIELNKGFNIE